MENEKHEIAKLLRQSLAENDYTPLVADDVQEIRKLIENTNR